MKNLVLIESILWYLRSRNFSLLITQVCPWILNSTDWENISWQQELSEEFITKFQDKVNWWRISEYQKLSEEFISKFQEHVDWWCITRYQKLSEEFMTKFQDKVYWYNVCI